MRTKLDAGYTLGNLGKNWVKRGAAAYKRFIEQFSSPETVCGFMGSFGENSLRGGDFHQDFLSTCLDAIPGLSSQPSREHH